jgi:ankyrin repeat protein
MSQQNKQRNVTMTKTNWVNELFHAVRGDDVAGVRQWIEEDAGATLFEQATWRGRSILAWAATHDAHQSVTLLMERFGTRQGERPLPLNAAYDQPLAEALLRGNLLVALKLLPYSTTQDFGGENPSMTCLAALSDRDDPEPCLTLALSIEPGAALEFSGQRGLTPLMAACGVGSVKSIRKLLPLSDATARDGSGGDALMHAAAAGCEEGVKMLLGLCDPLNRDHEGKNALMQSLAISSVACFSLLLPVSDLDALDSKDRSVLDCLDPYEDDQKKEVFRSLFEAERCRRERVVLNAAAHAASIVKRSARI